MEVPVRVAGTSFAVWLGVSFLVLWQLVGALLKVFEPVEEPLEDIRTPLNVRDLPIIFLEKQNGNGWRLTMKVMGFEPSKEHEIWTEKIWIFNCLLRFVAKKIKVDDKFETRLAYLFAYFFLGFLFRF